MNVITTRSIKRTKSDSRVVKRKKKPNRAKRHRLNATRRTVEENRRSR